MIRSLRPLTLIVAALVFSLLLFALLLARPVAAVGSDTVITVCTDANFNAALTAAQANGGGGKITFNCGAPTVLTLSGQKQITSSVTISSSGELTMVAAAGSRHFVVHPSAALTLANLTLSGGDARPNDLGGSIVVDTGSLTTVDVRFFDNRAGLGGALYLYTAHTTLTRTTFISNSASSGAGAFGASFGVLLAHDLRVEHNQGGSLGGGAVFQSLADLKIDGATIVSNTAQSGGGSVFTGVSSGVLTDVVIADNEASFIGGGMFIENSKLRAHELELTLNQAISSGGGIALMNNSNLALTSSQILSNSAELGGGVTFIQSVATITDGRIAGNRANANGGGALFGTGQYTLIGTEVISNVAEIGGGLAVRDGNVTIAESRIAGNSADGGGGVQAVFSGTVHLVDSQIVANQSAVAGGGVLADAKGTVNIDASTIAGNRSAKGGGVTALADGRAVMTNTTLSNNSATSTIGDAIWAGSGSLPARIEAIHSTITGRTSALPPQSTGVFAETGATILLTNSVLSRAAAFNCQEAGGSITFAGSYSTDASCGSTGVTQIADARLGPLTDNGGLTPTHLPLAGSPLLDVVLCPPGVTTDQRGESRIASGLCDAGAVEQPVGITPPSDLLFAPAGTFAGPQPVGKSLGVLSTVDSDPGDLFTYSVTSSSAPMAIANGNNVLTANLLVATTPLSRGTHNVTVQSVDRAANSISRTFQIVVNNGAPSVPALTPPAPIFTGTQPVGTVIGLLSATDPDGDTLAFTTSNAAFTIAGTEVRVATAIGKGVHSLPVTVSDGHGGSNQATFQVTVNDAAPSAITFSPAAPILPFGVAPGTLVAQLGLTGGNQGGAVTFALLNQVFTPAAAGAEAYFALSGAQNDQVVVAPGAELAMGSYTLTLEATDGGGAKVRGTLVVTVGLPNSLFVVPVRVAD